MPHAVSNSVDDFLEAVAEAVVIVLIVSLVSLGVRTGMVVVISIPVVLAVTALFMYFFDIGLHKISLGTLILALGLLVDDAIIAVEMMAVKLEQGWNRTRAAAYAYTSTAFPMLTGTLVTVAGFLPIALAKSSTGEYTRSIFEVSAIALIVSWLAAVVLIPLVGYKLLPERKREAHEAHLPDDHEHDIYDTKFYHAPARLGDVVHRAAFRRARRHGRAVRDRAGGLHAGAAAVLPEFEPAGVARRSATAGRRLVRSDVARGKTPRKDAAGRPEIDHVVSFVGTGAPRFYLPLDQQLPQPNFAQFVITAKTVKDREKLRTLARTHLARKIPRDAHAPVATGKRAAGRLSGAVPRVRRRHRRPCARSPKKSPPTCAPTARTTNVQFDWDEPSERSVRFEVDQKKARELGVSSQDVSNFLAMSLSGYTVTQYREHDKLIGVDLRAPLARTRRSVAARDARDADTQRPACRSARSGGSSAISNTA